MKKIAFISSSLFLLPYIASAQALGNPTPIFNLIDAAGQILNKVVPLLIALTVVVFFWGLFMYVTNPGKKQAEAKSVMIAGITALFVMVSVWGIIKVVQNTLLPGGSGSALQAPRVY